ncbi:Putative HTH-type transcriptional regulator [Candidatus Thermoflexus japonica]|uniref:HTH-type transcriptional regulator n=1 Tax=Candidatus Thermoflexus japonica TaxID=2035417 RepID=A0A2H5Y3G9_9CHLR|nr:Putative HTH-type transcriptional regulator [Candidatus Thermoflexus japonica]
MWQRGRDGHRSSTDRKGASSKARREPARVLPILKISPRVDYAIRILVDLATRPTGWRAQARGIACRQNIPPAFLYKVLKRLQASGYIDVRRGRKGGVRLIRPADRITLLDVAQSLEGPLVLHPCPHPEACALHELWSRIEADLCAWMACQTIADLAMRERKRGDLSRGSQGGSIGPEFAQAPPEFPR